jgi:hypothetical protein
MQKYKLASLVEKKTLSERWYVEYYYLDSDGKKFRRFRVFISKKLYLPENIKKTKKAKTNDNKTEDADIDDL